MTAEDALARLRAAANPDLERVRPAAVYGPAGDLVLGEGLPRLADYGIRPPQPAGFAAEPTVLRLRFTSSGFPGRNTWGVR